MDRQAGAEAPAGAGDHGDTAGDVGIPVHADDFTPMTSCRRSGPARRTLCGLGAVALCRPDQRVEGSLVALFLGMPLHAQDEAGGWELDSLDHAVEGRRRDDEAGGDVPDGLVV